MFRTSALLLAAAAHGSSAFEFTNAGITQCVADRYASTPDTWLNTANPEDYVCTAAQIDAWYKPTSLACGQAQNDDAGDVWVAAFECPAGEAIGCFLHAGWGSVAGWCGTCEDSCSTDALAGASADWGRGGWGAHIAHAALGGGSHQRMPRLSRAATCADVTTLPPPFVFSRLPLQGVHRRIPSGGRRRQRHCMRAAAAQARLAAAASRATTIRRRGRRRAARPPTATTRSAAARSG